MMGRGLSPLQKDLLKRLAAEPADEWGPTGPMTLGKLSRCATGRGAYESTCRALRRLVARGLVSHAGWRKSYRLIPDLTITERAK
jgi:hypothetical protein